MRVAATTETNALTVLETEWRDLAALCPTATIFQTWEWNRAWWRHLGQSAPGRKLCVLTFRNAAGALVGLAPLMTSLWHGTLLRRLSFLGTGVSDYHDILAAPGSEDAVCDAFYAHLRGMRGWQVADFAQLREDGLLRARPPKPESGLTWQDAPGEACPFLPLPADWETLARGLGKKTRGNIAYYERALRKLYGLDIGALDDPDALDDELQTVFDLHQRRWNQRWLPGVFGSGRVRRFHREAARALLAQGWLRLFLLRLDGQTQAGLYCFAFGDRLCYYQGGFEPTLARHSLGTILTAHALQTAVAEKRAVFDFLRGDEPYKAKWTTSSQVNVRRMITRRGAPAAPLARAASQIEDRIERRVKAWMRRKKN